MALRRWGPERVVNATTTGAQVEPSVAALAGGGYVIAWTDAGGATPLVRYQVFDAAGAAVGTEQVGYFDGPGSQEASVAALAGGGFVIAAESNYWARDVRQSLYDADGAPRTLGYVAVTFADEGDPAVAAFWTGTITAYEQDGDIHARLADGAGNPGAPGASVLSDGAGTQLAPDVAQLAGGGAVVAWYDATAFRIEARLLDAAASPQDADITVSQGAAYAEGPSVTALANGSFVVVWTTLGGLPPANGADVRARVFGWDGAPLTGEFILSTGSAGDQVTPDVVALASGGFAVLWIDESLRAIRGRLYDPAGLPQGAEFQISTGPEDAASIGEDLSVDELSDGRLVVAWVGTDDDGSAGIRSQIVDARDGVVTGTSASETLYGNAAVADEVNGLGGDDSLLGLSGDDALFGGAGADALLGERGDDDLLGGSGDDSAWGGAGADSVDGGAGLDRAAFATAVAFALDGAFAATGEAAGDAYVNVEGLEGSAFADRLGGDDRANTLLGGGGADRLEGREGNDSLLGGDGNDTLTGGTGGDRLWGDAGDDRFVFAALADSGLLGSARDSIFGFAGGDRIVLTALDANALLTGNQALALDAGGAFAAGEIRQVPVAGGLRLDLNVDADADAEMTILVAGATDRLDASAFDL